MHSLRIALALLVPALMGFPRSLALGAELKQYAVSATMPDLVGILPPANSSVSMAAPDTMRKVTAIVMVCLGYLPICSPAQEEDLRAIGLTDGGQLRAFETKKLAKTLGVDGLLMINVETFNDVNIGIFRSRDVAATTSLMNAKGEKIWVGRAETSKMKIANPLDAEKVADSFVEGLSEKLGEKILRIYLLEEASETAILAAGKFPEWPETPPKKLKRILKDLRNKEPL